MTRTEEREQAFIFIFEKLFNAEENVSEIIEKAEEARMVEASLFASSLAVSVYENSEEIDGVIEKYSKGWKKERLPKVTLAILRLAICEILYVSAIPTAVSINEAVELAKKYATPEDASFINGILGSFSRSLQTL